MEIPYQVSARPDTGLWNAKIGIWLFLASEVMLFGGLFSGYVFLRMGVTEGLDNPWPSRQLDILPGFINTLVLIASSVFVVLAWSEVKMRNFARYQFWMRLVVACALIFMCIKAYEYSQKFTHHGMKFEDNSVVEGVLKKDRIDFKATGVTVNISEDRLEFIADLEKGSGAPEFRTAEGETITLTKSWMREQKAAADALDEAAEKSGSAERANRLVELEAVNPLTFHFKPRNVKNYDAAAVTYRDAATIKGELIDDKILFEVHDVDMRMADDKEHAIAWKYLGHHVQEEFFEHRKAVLEDMEKGHILKLSEHEPDFMHVHAENHEYPEILVDRADKKFLSNHGPAYNTYYAIYFTLTGLHGLHVVAGGLVLSYFLFFQKKLYKTNPEHLANRVEVGGLFWHFVDLIWIFLFPIMYLM